MGNGESALELACSEAQSKLSESVVAVNSMLAHEGFSIDLESWCECMKV